MLTSSLKAHMKNEHKHNSLTPPDFGPDGFQNCVVILQRADYIDNAVKKGFNSFMVNQGKQGHHHWAFK